MDTDIDTALGRIGRQGPHPGLDGLEHRVLASIAERSAQTLAMRILAGGAAFALILGVASGALSSHEARASSFTPLGVAEPLAPSTLLLGPR